MTTLGAGDDREALLLGLFAGGDDSAGADRVDGDGLLDEAMLTGGDGRGEVHWAESRRGRHEHEGAVGGHDFLVGVVADEDLVRGKLVSVVQALGTVLESISQGDDLGFGAEQFAGRNELAEGASAAAAATDQGDFDLGRDRLAAQDGRGGGQGETADGQGGDEIATLDGVFHDLRLWGLPKAHKGFLSAA